MKLYIKNVGLVKEAEVNINGLTIITGANDSGKSTIGKSIYSAIHGSNNYVNDFYANKLDSIQHISLYLSTYLEQQEPTERVTDILGAVENLNDSISLRIDTKVNEAFIEKVATVWAGINHELSDIKINESVYNRIDDIDRIFKLKKEDKSIKILSLQKTLDIEFTKQINNLYIQDEEATLRLINDNEIPMIDIKIKNNIIKEDESDVRKLNQDVTMIESPLILNDLKVPFFNMFKVDSHSHVDNLKNKLIMDNDNIIDDYINNMNIKNINDKISIVLGGNILRDSSNKLVYRQRDKDINIINLANGLKSFALIKMLLKNNTLSSGDILILDEPEIHLHPDWQVYYAEMIVLMAKELGVRIVLTSHSPYFIEAIETFAKRHHFLDHTNFYYAYKEGDSAYIDEITDDMEKIYKQLLAPFEKLEDLQEEDE